MLFSSLLRHFRMNLELKCEKMPADNDHVESGEQIATPSSLAPCPGKPTAPIIIELLHIFFRYQFLLSVMVTFLAPGTFRAAMERLWDSNKT